MKEGISGLLCHSLMIAKARSAPPGPAILIDDPPLLKMPAPITTLITMNCEQIVSHIDTQQLPSQNKRLFRRVGDHTKIIHPWRSCLHHVSLH